MATTDLETRVRNFKEEVAEAIQREFGDKPHWFYGSKIPINIGVDPNYRNELFKYLADNQNRYGELHPIEFDDISLSEPINGILINSTRERAITLAGDTDKAYTGDNAYKPLKRIKSINTSSAVGHLH